MKTFIIFIMLWLSFVLAVISDSMEFKATGNCDHCLILSLDN